MDTTFNKGSVSHTPQLGRIAYCEILIIIACTVVQLGVQGGGGGAVSPPQWVQGQSPEKFWLFCILNNLKHHSHGSATTTSDKTLQQKSTLLRVWRSEFGVPNLYTGFKIAWDMALSNSVQISYNMLLLEYQIDLTLQRHIQNSVEHA